METIKRYNKHQEEIKSKIDLLTEKLKKHKTQFENNTSNWGFVGDIEYINNYINEIINFINVD